jgi:uncharacterized membrane protein
MVVTEMSTGRLEAFSDSVIAIIVTIMALELRPGLARSQALPCSTGARKRRSNDIEREVA